jgi:hypothetical protein
MESMLEFWKSLNQVQKVTILGVASLLAVDIYLGTPLGAAPKKKAPEYTVGQDIDVAVTLVTTDSRTLACASQEVVKGKRCEFDGKKEPWAKSADVKLAPLDTLAPYKTTDDQLFLIPGLFADPALKHRLEIDPPTSNGEHARFVANCKLHIEGKIGHMQTRWHLNGEWGTANDGWVGTVSNCLLSDA